MNFGQTPITSIRISPPTSICCKLPCTRGASARGSTALYDASCASAIHLRNNPRLDKKVLLVITDGQDNMSRETLQQAMHHLQPRQGRDRLRHWTHRPGTYARRTRGAAKPGHRHGRRGVFPAELDEVNTVPERLRTTSEPIHAAHSRTDIRRYEWKKTRDRKRAIDGARAGGTYPGGGSALI